ncbi:MAG: lytic transglycosylase domain-containing protein [Pseudomonadota bacterium]
MGTLMRAILALALCSTAPATAGQVDRWAPLIAEASSRFAVPVDWITRVMRAESGGRTMLNGRPIVSHAGAMGLMQVMPGTWRELRAMHGLGADPHNPRDNIIAGTAYLRMMYDRFGYPGLFAAYNAGPARYAAALRSGRTLPAETRAYVAKLVQGRPPSRSGHVRPRPPDTALFVIVRPTGRSGDSGSGVGQAGSKLFFVRMPAFP